MLLKDKLPGKLIFTKDGTNLLVLNQKDFPPQNSDEFITLLDMENDRRVELPCITSIDDEGFIVNNPDTQLVVIQNVKYGTIIDDYIVTDIMPSWGAIVYLVNIKTGISKKMLYNTNVVYRNGTYHFQ